ncbi:MAG: hypothetical protein IJR13_04575 [Bacteroidales bacterium]|nr:hypothetical protein [Bacteroidales bacterium]
MQHLPISGIIGSLADGTVCRGSSVVLDGAASFTPAADEVSYSWSAEPAGATAGMPANVGTASIEVSPTVQTTYTVTATPSRGGCAGTPATHSATLTILEPTHLAFTHTAIETFTWAETDNDGSQNGTHGTGETYTDDGTHTYVSSYTNGDGCPSSDTLYLTIVNTIYSDTTAVACGSFTWYGNTYTESSEAAATHTFTASTGVDSVVTLHLTIRPIGQGEESQTSCDSYTWHGTPYLATGDYTYTTTNGSANGCDSVTTLHLVINASKIGDTLVNDICDNFTWHGITYTESSTPTHRYTAANGCDSTVTLNLVLKHSSTYTDVQHACDSYEWIDGNTYTASNSTATYQTTNAAGCDSTVTLSLTLGHSSVTTDVQAACDSYEWIDGNTYTENNSTATYQTTNGEGCPDTRTLNLTISHATTHTDVRVECDSYTWIDGQTYTASTTSPVYTITGGNARGCDSIVTLHLTINHSSSENLGSEYVCTTTTTWNGNTYAVPGTYSYVSTNAAGCPLTQTKTFNYGVTFANDAQRVTVCAGTNTYSYTETLLEDDFHSGLSSGAGGWYSGSTYGTDCYNYWVRRDQYGRGDAYIWKIAAYITYNGTRYYGYTGSSSVTDGQLMCLAYQNNSYCASTAYVWSPVFTVTNPANVNIQYKWRAPGRSSSSSCNRNYHNGFNGWLSAANGPSTQSLTTVQSTARTHTYGAANAAGYTSWQTVNLTMSSIQSTAGTYRLCFFFQDLFNGGAAVDNLLVTETKSINIASIPNGGYYSSNSVTTNSYGCPHYSGLVIHKQTAGETYNEAACESYRWINGTTYTTDQTNTGYTHTISENGTSCSVTDRLNLSVNHASGTPYANTANGSYTWPTSGAFGHGSGLNYNEDGTYLGVYYANGVCQNRDTLHLTINHDACAGSKYMVSACDNYTWPASGTYGNGDGLSHAASGTFYGPSYTPSECAITVHDTLVLTINQSNSGSDTRTVQHTELPYTWNGQTFTSADVKVATLHTTKGCDSTLTMTLNVEQRTTQDLCYYPSSSGTYWDTLYYNDFNGSTNANSTSQGSAWSDVWKLSTTDYITNNTTHHYGPEPTVATSAYLSYTGERVYAYNGNSLFLYSQQYYNGGYKYGANSRYISPIIRFGDLSQTEISFQYMIYESNVGVDELNFYWRSPDLNNQYDFIGDDASTDWVEFSGTITDWLPSNNVQSCNSYRFEIVETDYWSAIGIDNLCIRERKTYSVPAGYPAIMIGKRIGTTQDVSDVTNYPNGSKLTVITTYRITGCSSCD